MQIHAFLEAGRGFVGECAGAFLATSDYFGFVEKVRVDNIQSWKRGGQVIWWEGSGSTNRWDLGVNG